MNPEKRAPKRRTNADLLRMARESLRRAEERERNLGDNPFTVYQLPDPELPGNESFKAPRKKTDEKED